MRIVKDNWKRRAAHWHSSAKLHWVCVEAGKKPHCVYFRVFDGKMAVPENEAAMQQHKKLIMSDMRQLNYFINKPFANGCCMLVYSRLKMYETYLRLN